MLRIKTVINKNKNKNAHTFLQTFTRSRLNQITFNCGQFSSFILSYGLGFGNLCACNSLRSRQSPAFNIRIPCSYLLKKSYVIFKMIYYLLYIPNSHPNSCFIHIVAHAQHRSLFLTHQYTVIRIIQLGHIDFVVSTARNHMAPAVIHQQCPNALSVHVNRLDAPLLTNAPLFDRSV